METFIYRTATRSEFQLAIEWAAAEGWNPGRHDADVFWETDPQGFVLAERAGEVIGTGSIVSYQNFGFMGFFIVKPGLRGQGIGAGFWNWRKQALQQRLAPGAPIGMDGVFDMQPFYAKGGFAFSHRNLRMEGIARPSPAHSSIVSLSQIPFHAIEAIDLQCFGFQRTEFLKRWIVPPDGLALAAQTDSGLDGFGVIRKCQRGYKIGPLFATSPIAAENLLLSLGNHAAGQPIFLDIPENNPAAVALARKREMQEVFGCARMYAGQAPQLPWENIYGITSFELG